MEKVNQNYAPSNTNYNPPNNFPLPQNMGQQQPQFNQQPQNLQQPQVYQQQPQQPFQQLQQPMYASPMMTTGFPMAPTVIIQQQPGMMIQRLGPSDWKTSFFGCFDDLGSCILSLFCPCMQYGQNKARLSNGDCVCDCLAYTCLMTCFLQWCLSCSARGQIRSTYNISGDSCCDCLAHFCCECCALSQEARELEFRKQNLPY